MDNNTDKGSRLSVAELAGKFACQAPLPTADEVNKPVRRRPPRTLPIPASNDVGQGQDEKAEVGSHPPRKNRNSALIEKLQASLPPTAFLPSPLSPGAGKPQMPFFPPLSPCSPVSPTSASKPSLTETPASFETPAEGSVLLSINKGRARHSIKRRPPSRRLRKSSGEEGETEEERATLTVSGLTTPDGKENDVFEKQKVEKEEIDHTNAESATSKQQQDQERHEESADSEQQPLASVGGEEESRECVVSGEKEETVEEEKKSEQPELDSRKEESTKQEHDDETTMETQRDLAAATEDKTEQEVKKEEEEGVNSV
ncbi:duboraya isoform X2 [Ictalurus punctatus]|uniref:Duboraya isoform X2 n=1 Tax=Ictalurus punctatus TaxID=7998 RepID=A0A979FDN7_ICTPU|nr:duboraya isoform X2 [Ictalurus punctatus]